VFNEGHQADTSGHASVCRSVTPFYDKAGATERTIYKFDTPYGIITITMFHTTRRIMIQGGVKNKVPQAPHFVKNILSSWLTVSVSAVGKDRELSQINQAILNMKIKRKNPPLSPNSQKSSKSNLTNSDLSVSTANPITRTPLMLHGPTSPLATPCTTTSFPHPSLTLAHEQAHHQQDPNSVLSHHPGQAAAPLPVALVSPRSLARPPYQPGSPSGWGAIDPTMAEESDEQCRAIREIGGETEMTVFV
jgi:hypothetical protein